MTGPSPSDSRREVTLSPDTEFGGEISDDPVVPIARFTSAAEAGYFAHELSHDREIPAVVTVDENFDAVTGNWWTRYVLNVPEPFADSAIEALQLLMVDGDDGDWEYSDVAESDLTSEIPANLGATVGPTMHIDRNLKVDDVGINWIPVVLTLAAGSVVFWGVRKFQDPPRPAHAAQPQQQHDLWEQMSIERGPWFQRMNNGSGVRQLWIDPRRNRAVLREDADGDGEFERVLPLSREAVVR